MTENILSYCHVVLEGSDHTYEGDSGPDGLIAFRDIEPDVYTLTVSKKGYEDYIETDIVIDDEHNTLRSKVALKELPHELTIICMITDLDGNNVENIKVVMYDLDGNIVYHGVSNVDGEIRFPHVKYGKYLVKAEGNEYKRNTMNITVNSTNKNPRQLAITVEKTDK